MIVIVTCELLFRFGGKITKIYSDLPKIKELKKQTKNSYFKARISINLIYKRMWSEMLFLKMIKIVFCSYPDHTEIINVRNSQVAND